MMNFEYVLLIVVAVSITFPIVSPIEVGELEIEPINVADVENSVDNVDDNGDKLCEGDIVCDGAKNVEGSDRNAINGERYRWPKENGIVIVPYVFDSSLAEQAKMQMQAAAADYAAWTCIKFVERTDQVDYIKFYRGPNCQSYFGRIGGEQSLSLGDKCYANKGTPSHEMMHAMGFFHEQSRTDRDQYVTVKKDLVEPGHEHNFDICTSCTNPEGMPYDYRSVLHYSSTAFSKNGEETIIPKTGSSDQIGQRGGLCHGDIKKLNQMYNCGGLTVSPTKPNNGEVPCDQPVDRWTNCQDMLRNCSNPKEDYKYLRNCPKTCLGKEKGGPYDNFNNCDSLTEGDKCATSQYAKENCSLSCEEKAKASGSKKR